MILQEVVKRDIPFRKGVDQNIRTNKFEKELKDLKRTNPQAWKETVDQINSWENGTNVTPMFEFKNRLTTGKPVRNIVVYGVQVRHRKPPVHAIVFVESLITGGLRFTWHRLFDSYDEYQKRAVSPGDALKIAQSYYDTSDR